MPDYKNSEPAVPEQCLFTNKIPLRYPARLSPCREDWVKRWNYRCALIDLSQFAQTSPPFESMAGFPESGTPGPLISGQ